jgi:hypothetical protein
MIKGRVIIVGAVAAVVIVALSGLYRVVVQRSPLTVTFLGYTNFVPGRLPRAVFAVTNTSARPVQRWGWEEHSASGRQGVANLGAVTLKPGQGEHLELSTGAWPTWRLAVLSTGTLKGTWNHLLTRTPYVASNQWDQLQFDRSFSQWVPGPPWVPAPPGAKP